MLVTDRRHKLPLQPLLYDVGMEGWRSVTLEIPMPYFIVSFALDEGGICWHEKAIILWRDEDLVSFCKSLLNAGNARLLQVDIISLVGEKTPRKWNTLQVFEIWVGRLRGHHGLAAICLDSEGRRMKSNAFLFECEIVEQSERIFSSRVD